MSEVDPSPAPVAVRLEGIRKTFGGVVALDDVTLEVSSGEVTALVGDNGAGKSTLVKVIAGIHQPDSGHVLIDGEECSFTSPRDSKAKGIEVVYQDLALADHQEVFMNMFLGRERTRAPFGLLQKKRMRRETEEILGELDVHIPSSSATVRNLSGGQRQGVAIGRAVHWAQRLVLMDEPTAALGVQETARVEETIKRMRQRGLAVLLVSHNLDQVVRLADRVYVLRRGRLVGERRVAETTGDEIVSMITGLTDEVATR